MNLNRLQRFFWIASGTPLEIIEKYPTEHSKYTGIGATIFFTALFAALSGGYALFFVFSGNPLAALWAVLFGLVWGLAIFNLDRYIVSSIKKTSRGLRQFYQASPRLVFAVLIAVVIARPLELKIFDKEIRSRLEEKYLADQQAEIEGVRDAFNEKYRMESARLERFQTEYDALSKDVDRLREELKLEVFGSASSTTSGVPGYGRYAKNKEAVVRSKEQRLEFLAARIAGLQGYLSDRKVAEGLDRQRMLSEEMLARKASTAGFADRNWALGQLAHSSDGADRSSANAIAFITMLFITLECAPLIVKLLSDAGPSDVDVSETESRIIAQLTNTAFLSKNRIIRQYRIMGSKRAWRRRSQFLSSRRSLRL
ncbi:DUF4407 domain-containing protein [Chlorobium sp. N1]|uniref:DUF4407 domain-containing protein n=1 Tax=Chlorobium sp. N1 TaxID=2491138 RepID=UPI00103E6932|nr:DUF4407 domain-containing protein [Chlorobium sp. N1]TCD48726.1 DUF4407 domain-containing protein [Chlorobium sp. N1]